MSQKNMKFCQEVELIIWSNFHVDYLNWITTKFEFKFKYRFELEFDLNSNGICEFDSIQCSTTRIEVQIGVSNIRDITAESSRVEHPSCISMSQKRSSVLGVFFFARTSYIVRSSANQASSSVLDLVG
jgi:hypothetical protein